MPVTVAPTAIYEALKHGNLDYSFINPGNIQQWITDRLGENARTPPASR